MAQNEQRPTQGEWGKLLQFPVKWHLRCCICTKPLAVPFVPDKQTGVVCAECAGPKGVRV